MVEKRYSTSSKEINIGHILKATAKNSLLLSLAVLIFILVGVGVSNLVGKSYPLSINIISGGLVTGTILFIIYLVYSFYAEGKNASVDEDKVEEYSDSSESKKSVRVRPPSE